MAEDPLDYVVLVVRNRPRRKIYVRAYPKTAVDPTLPQINARIAFGEIARMARGKKFEDMPLPPAAMEVARLLKGLRFGRTVKKPKWLERLELRLARTLGPEEALRIVGELEKKILGPHEELH